MQAAARDALHAERAHVILRELGQFRRESNSQTPQLAIQGSQTHAGEGLCHSTCPVHQIPRNLHIKARRPQASRGCPSGKCRSEAHCHVHWEARLHELLVGRLVNIGQDTDVSGVDGHAE